ncbi:hypothetical protein EJ03DRAFT_348124 [Teratosphaeria nubilosa]|uniref:Uncharacterized protein n=1 Tax=Teratosphaeria nubilosa TaxID=161662 RepID=A0A6G1LKD2_9PEZI|nr:hypothetical protein EJ03DRAFT_348124 [Teratosphaeria nubilosa]
MASIRFGSQSASRDGSRFGAQQPYGCEHPGAPYDIYQPAAELQAPWQTVTHRAMQRMRSQSVASSKTTGSARTSASLKTNVSSHTTASSGANSGVDSYCSCQGLSPTDPARRIKAAEARRQIQQAPPSPPRPVGYARRGGGGYPKTFWNREGLPLQTRGPLTKFSVMASGSWYSGTRPGAVRGVYNERSRADMDVMYHDPRKPGSAGREDQSSVASYRPRRRGLERLYNL